VLGMSRLVGRSRTGRRQASLLAVVAALSLLGPALAAGLGGTAAQAAGGPQVTQLTASATQATVGQTVMLSATISPPPLLSSITVNFTIVSGPNAGGTFSCIASGTLLPVGSTSCSQSYSSTLAGTDTISAAVPGQSPGVTVAVTWLGIPATVLVAPALSFNHTGDSVLVTATVLDSNGVAVPSAAVAFQASGTGGESPNSGSASTNASGQAAFTFTSTTSGKSTVVASSTAPGGTLVTGSATAYFAGDPSSIVLREQNANAIAPVGGTDTVTAAITDAAGTPVGDGTNVTFTVTGAGAQIGQQVTSGGNAIFNFSSQVTGTSTVTASSHSAISNVVTATWESPVPAQIGISPRIASAVIGHTQSMVAGVVDQFGQPFVGALVRFVIEGANASATTSSGDTDTNGEVGFQYTGVNTGIDSVVAFVDLNDDDTLDPGDPYTIANILWKQKPGQGYWLVASDGGIFNYGPSAKFEGSAGGIHLNQPIVGMAATADGGGYWLVASDGGIFNYGDAAFHGSAGSIHLNKPIVGMAATPDGGGYWLVASDGGIFAYGDAKFYGSAGSIHLNRPIVGMAATADGGGYWLVASDGGIFAYGDAAFQGSTGSIHLNKPIVGMAATPDGGGYWLVASDGGIFAYGDAAFQGSTGSINLNKPIVAMGAISDGSGYFLAASDGGVFAFGPGATSFGSAASGSLNKPVVGMAVAP
jgi:hypothetical protein